MTAAAVLGTEMGVVLGDRRSIWWHAVILTAGPLLILLLWESVSLDFFLDRGKGPGTLGSLTLMMGSFLLTIAGAFTLDLVPRNPGHPFLHWLKFTPAGPTSYLVGRTMYHLTHSMLLGVLVLPSMMTAGVASLADPGEVLILTGFLVYICFCLRLTAETGRRYDRNTGSLAILVYVTVLLVYLLVSSSSFPAWSLIHALRSLSEPALETPVPVFRTFLLFTGIAFLASAISWWRLVVFRNLERLS